MDRMTDNTEDQTDPIVFPRTETERLILRHIETDEIPFLLEHYGKDEINKELGYDNLTRMEEAEEYLEKYFRQRSGAFRTVIELRSTGELVGTIGLHLHDLRDRRAEMGYDLNPDHWGEGIMTEAAVEIVRFGFKVMGLHRIEATADEANARSLRLLERLGFVLEGTSRDKHFYLDHHHNERFYGLLKQDFEDAGYRL